MEITEEQFWIDFWGQIKLPQIVDLTFKNDRIIAENIMEYIPKAQLNRSVLEIGCAPGKWLAFFNQELNYNIAGIEYVRAAASKTVENFQLLNIPDNQYSVQTADFLSVTPEPIYDVVFSFGFIEHFDEWEEIIDKHIAYCKSKGYLILGLPNFKGISYGIQKMIDKYGNGNKLLPVHNLEVMDLNKIRAYIQGKNLDILKLDYVGGFEPTLFNTEVNNWAIKNVLRCIVKGSSLLLNKCNTQFTASYILGVFKLK